MIRRSLAALAVLVFAGCGEREDGGAGSPPAAEPAAPSAAESPAADTFVPLDSAALAAEMSADSALVVENRRSYEERLRSMAGYTECMRQARDVPPEVRARIEAACGRLPDAP